MKPERRFTAGTPPELVQPRAATGTSSGGRLSGYAALYDTPATISDQFIETIRLGAFKAAIARSDVRALLNHDPNLVLGRLRAGTLTLAEDARGLRYTVELPETQVGRDLRVSVSRGDITASSFGFTVKREQWRPPATRGALPTREILEVDRLFDVSPVTFPAYEQTTVSVARTAPRPTPRSSTNRARLALAEREAQLHRIPVR